jgi:hypothetical protein
VAARRRHSRRSDRLRRRWPSTHDGGHRLLARSCGIFTRGRSRRGAAPAR